MTALERLSLFVLALVAPSEHRAAILGDVLEECALRREAGEAPARIARWVARQAATSLPPLLLLRAQRAGAARVSLAVAGAAATAAATQTSEQAAWRQLLSHVPLRADHAPPLAWIVMSVVLQCIVAGLVAVLLLRVTRPGGRT